MSEKGQEQLLDLDADEDDNWKYVMIYIYTCFSLRHPVHHLHTRVRKNTPLYCVDNFIKAGLEHARVGPLPRALRFEGPRLAVKSPGPVLPILGSK